jgi:pantothenate kinase-related protein Tda10
MFSRDNINCLSLSLDDFYLTGNEQDNIAQNFSKNPLLQYRGNGN